MNSFPAPGFSPYEILRAITAWNAQRTIRHALPLLLVPAGMFLFVCLRGDSLATWFRDLSGLFGSALIALAVALLFRPNRLVVLANSMFQLVASVVLLAGACFLGSFGTLILVLAGAVALIGVVLLSHYENKLAPIWQSSPVMVWTLRQFDAAELARNVSAQLIGNRAVQFRLFDRLALVFDEAAGRCLMIKPRALQLASTEVFNDPTHPRVRACFDDGTVADGRMLASDYEQLRNWNEQSE